VPAHAAIRRKARTCTSSRYGFVTHSRPSIRRAAPADAAAILDCLSSAFASYSERYTAAAYADTVLSTETIRERMASMSLFVAGTPGGEIVGTIGCRITSPGEGHLRGMAVLPPWQGHGVAADLLAAAEAELRNQHCARITLDTTEPLQRAMRFYEKYGYLRSGKVTDFFGMPLFEYVKIIAPE
jgi:GNAT superfamily N-acetyltransferase